MKPDINKLKEALLQFDRERIKFQNLIHELEDVPKMKACVGKYYKYHNSYNQNEKWWLYYYVKAFKPKSGLVVDYFEEDYRGKVEFMSNKIEYGLTFYNPNYIEITKEEYYSAAKKTLHKLNKNFK